MLKTNLCRHTRTDVFYREKNIVDYLSSETSFSSMLFYQILDRDPGAHELKLFDAVLIVLMEHGLTPSSISTRLSYMSDPGSLQGAVAAGIQSVGSAFVGTMEDCGKLLERIGKATEQQRESEKIVWEYRNAGGKLPGFGHHLHKPTDPRAVALIRLAESLPDCVGPYLKALRKLEAAAVAVYGEKVFLNATSVISALLGDMGFPARIMRGIAVVARAGGLVAHIHEEQSTPLGRDIWKILDEATNERSQSGVALEL